jgi:hypothetical protein
MSSRAPRLMEDAMSATTATLIGVFLTFVVSSVGLVVQGMGVFWQKNQAWITDRITKAIEHLGDGSRQVRVGAVFELERIAKDSHNDRPHIVSTLAAFIRDISPESKAKEQKADEDLDVLLVRAPDAQAALTVLCRPPLSLNRPDSSEVGGLDLSRTDLRKARLTDAQLYSTNLYNSHLEGADLRHANLSNANLKSADFGRLPGFERGADLRHANLTGVSSRERAKHLDDGVALLTPTGPTNNTFAQCKGCGR